MHLWRIYIPLSRSWMDCYLSAAQQCPVQPICRPRVLLLSFSWSRLMRASGHPCTACLSFQARGFPCHSSSFWVLIVRSPTFSCCQISFRFSPLLDASQCTGKWLMILMYAYVYCKLGPDNVFVTGLEMLAVRGIDDELWRLLLHFRMPSSVMFIASSIILPACLHCLDNSTLCCHIEILRRARDVYDPMFLGFVRWFAVWGALAVLFQLVFGWIYGPSETSSCSWCGSDVLQVRRSCFLWILCFEDARDSLFPGGFLFRFRSSTVHSPKPQILFCFWPWFCYSRLGYFCFLLVR